MDKREKTRLYLERVAWATKLLNEKPGKKIGVEIGLWKADFAQPLLKENSTLTWIGIDPYFMYGKRARNQAEWDAIFHRVEKKMAPFGSRFSMIRRPSAEAATLIPNVDFLFVDGNHDKEFVLRDLILFSPKVRFGGIVAGHDYALKGVKQAVDEYTLKMGITATFETFDPFGIFWWRKG